jgi:hypothetical protein
VKNGKTVKLTQLQVELLRELIEIDIIELAGRNIQYKGQLLSSLKNLLTKLEA